MNDLDKTKAQREQWCTNLNAQLTGTTHRYILVATTDNDGEVRIYKPSKISNEEVKKMIIKALNE